MFPVITVEQIGNVETRCYQLSVRDVTDTTANVSQRTCSYRCLRRGMLFLALHVLIHVEMSLTLFLN